MDKAIKVAVEKYPYGIFDGKLGDAIRAACAVGYEQAEKDLALTWEDVKQIEDLCMEVTTLFASVGRNKVILEPPFYEEVLKRFNKQRNGRCNLQKMP